MLQTDLTARISVRIFWNTCISKFNSNQKMPRDAKILHRSLYQKLDSVSHYIRWNDAVNPV